MELALSGASVTLGEAYLADTPVLRPHAGTQPDLFLRWNEIPLAAPSVDVVVYLHGFSQQGGAMLLAEKAAASGLDLSGRKRPTIALLPRGNWLRYTWYDFPALLSGGMDRLVDHALQQFAHSMGRGTLAADRLILAAHSGGGMPAVDTIAGAGEGRTSSMCSTGSTVGILRRTTRCGGWKRSSDGSASVSRASRSATGALRVIYIEQQTGPFSRQVGELISRQSGGALTRRWPRFFGAATGSRCRGFSIRRSRGDACPNSCRVGRGIRLVAMTRGPREGR